MNEKGITMTQKVSYECKPIYCGDCGGIGHTLKDYRRKPYELALAMVKPRQIWVAKPRANPLISSSKAYNTINGAVGCAMEWYECD